MLWWILGSVGGVVVFAAIVLVILRRRFKSRTLALWLAADEPGRPRGERFKEPMLDPVPEPARRYLRHALKDDLELKTRVELRGAGEIRIGGQFKPFTSLQLLVPGRGFVWRARMGAPVEVVDHYLDDDGEVRGLLLGCLPLFRQGGAEVSRSSRHRLAIESIWLPDALLPINGVSWDRLSDTRARAKLLIDAEPIDLTLTIAPDGRLERIEMMRFSDGPGDKTFRFRRYVALIEAEATFDGRTIPTEIAVGHAEAGSEEVDVGFRVTIEQASFR